MEKSTFTNKILVEHEVPKEWIKEQEIEYKQVDAEVFKKRGYKVEKVMLPTTNDYQTKNIIEHIDRGTENTVIVNIGTGQGKSIASNTLIKSYYEDGYIVIIASPFKSLVEKDYRYLSERFSISKDDMFDYRELEDDKSKFLDFNEEKKKEYIKEKSSKPIHVLTINSLLANPGDNAFWQNPVKSWYINSIKSFASESKKKIVFIFDEIHETVFNFKNELMFFLRQWKKFTHKSIILTATFTEPTYVVAMHIAYLTNDTIKILEAPRLKNPPSRIAELELYFCRENYSSKSGFGELDYIKAFITKKEYKRYHILSYSEKIAKALKEELKEVIDINLVVGSSADNFSNKRHNIGTTFKTGVSIDEPHAMIIITPPQYGNFFDRNSIGIFHDGVPSIIQSFARLRNGGKIIVFIPKLKSFINTLSEEELEDEKTQYIDYLKNVFPYIFSQYKPLDSSDDVSFKSQLYKLEGFYEKQYEKIEFEKKYYDKTIASANESPMELASIDEIIYRFYEREQNFKNFRDRVSWMLTNNAFRNVELDKIKNIIDNSYAVSMGINTKEVHNKTFELTIEGTKKKIEKKLSQREASLVKRPPIQYPELDNFILTKGQQYLVWSEEKYGKGISPYILWAAFHNQFQNCNLTKVLSHNYTYIDFISNNANKKVKVNWSQRAKDISNFLRQHADLTKEKLLAIRPEEALNICTKSFNIIKEGNTEKKVRCVIDGREYPRFHSSSLCYQWVISYLYHIRKHNIYIDLRKYLLGNIFLAQTAHKDELTELGEAYLKFYSVVMKFHKMIKEYESKNKKSLPLPKKDYREIVRTTGIDIFEDNYSALIQSIAMLRNRDKLIRFKKISFLQKLDFKKLEKDEQFNILYTSVKKVFFKLKHSKGKELEKRIDHKNYNFLSNLSNSTYQWSTKRPPIMIQTIYIR